MENRLADLDEPKLTERQKRFIDAYVRLGKGKEAAIEAGYSPKVAGQEAYRSLKKDYIRLAIEKRQGEICAKTRLSDEEILLGVELIAKTAKNDSDKLKAYEMLGKAKRLFSEPVEKLVGGHLVQQFFVTLNISRPSRITAPSTPPNPLPAASISDSQSTSSPSMEHSTIDTSATCLDSVEPTTRVDNISLPKEVNTPPEGSCDNNMDLHKSVSQISTLDTHATSQESGKESETNEPITLRRSDDDTT